MSITYYMVQLPNGLLFLLLVLAGGSIAALTTYLFRKVVKMRILKSHNVVAGNFFLVIGSFYALLLSFVVLVVWNQLSETQGIVSREGSSALALYRDIKFYPDSAKSNELLTYYLDFSNNVIHEEFPNMRSMKLSRKTPESLNNVFHIMERLNPENPHQVQLAGQMFDHLNELANFRGLRTSSINAEIPPFMWLPIILGAIIVIISGLFLDIEHRRGPIVSLPRPVQMGASRLIVILHQSRRHICVAKPHNTAQMRSEPL